MNDLLKTVREFKTKAKNRRDDELYDEGVGFAAEAISLLKAEFATAKNDEWKTQLASELGDCHGIIGGIQRRWGLSTKEPYPRAEHLVQSVLAYEAGDEWEREKNYGVVNSYNLVNRLVSRMLLSASDLVELPQELEALDIPSALLEASSIVDEQLILKRRGDIWAMADQALLRILLQEADHTSAFSELRAKSPPDYLYESLLATLEPLVALELPMAQVLQRSVELLERDLESI